MNEGFATLYENHLTHLVYPDGRWIDTFLVDTVQWVLETDANPNIRSMSFYVESPSRIDNLFDSVAYSKCTYEWHISLNDSIHSLVSQPEVS